MRRNVRLVSTYEMANIFDHLSGGYMFSTAEPAGSVYSFDSDATHGSNHEELFEDDLPSLAVINRHYDVLEELMMVMRARGKANLQKEAKHAHESPFAKGLTLFGEVTPSTKATEKASGVGSFLLAKPHVGFEFGQKDPVTFTSGK